MAALTSSPTQYYSPHIPSFDLFLPDLDILRCHGFVQHSLHCMQHERFSKKQNGCRLRHLSLNLSGNIAVSGYHDDKRTFIDLYFGRNSNSSNKFKLFYSKDFAKYSNYWRRYVSFLGNNDDSKLVTCIGDRIEIINTKQESKVLSSYRINGKTRCLAVREGEIYVGLYKSHTVIVFNNDLQKTKNVILKDIQDGDWPWDLQVIKDTVFVSTGNGRVYSKSESDSSNVNVREYTDTTEKYRVAGSITVSERLGLVAVLWHGTPGKGIIVYSLNEEKSFLVFPVDDNVTRIRISDRDSVMMTGNRNTGEIKVYDLEQLFSFQAMKRTLAYMASPDESEELRKYFGVSGEELKNTEVDDEEESHDEISEEEKAIKRMECLLTIIEEKGHLNPYNINNLMDAVSTLGDETPTAILTGPIEGYSLHGLKLKDMMTEMMIRQKDWENERNQLSSRLETAECRVKEYEETLDDLQRELFRVKNPSEEQEGKRAGLKDKLEQSLDLKTAEFSASQEELAQAREKSAKEIQSLSEQLKATKQTYHTAEAESSKGKERLTKHLNETNQSLVLSRRDSTRKIASLKDEITHVKVKIEELQEQRRILSDELGQSKLSIHFKTAEFSALKEELAQAREASTKEIELLSEQLKATELNLHTCKTESSKEIERLTKRLDETNQSLFLNKKESSEKIATLTVETGHMKENIEELEGQRRTLTDELRQSKLSIHLRIAELATLKEELAQAGEESTKEIELLSEQLKATELNLHTSKTESSKETERLTKRLDETNQSLFLNKKESSEKIATLTDEAGRMKENIEELEGQRRTLTDELRQSKLSIHLKTAELAALKEELAQASEKSKKEIELLSEQLKATKQKHHTNEAESSKEIERLTKHLDETNQSLILNKTKSSRKITALTHEIDLIKTECLKDLDTLKEELEQNNAKSEKEIETLKGELNQSKQSLDSSRAECTKSAKEIESLIETLNQIQQNETEAFRQLETITGELNQTKQTLSSRTKNLEKATRNLEVTEQNLEETRQDRDNTRTELKRYQLDFTMESKALKEVLSQTKEVMAELQMRTVEDKPMVDSKKTEDKIVPVLAAEFGRLHVAIAEHLTLDDCLKLATIYNIPVSDCDTVLRISLIESPGMKFLDVLKERNIINMFDVTNLQKGLAMLHLEVVNHNLVVPYQEKIDEEQFELHRTEEMFTWEKVEDFLNAAQMGDSQTTLEDDNEFHNTSQAETTTNQSEGEQDSGPILRCRYHNHLYTEHVIGREGGTIQVANVSLLVPPDALQQSQVIALSVMNESPFPMDGEFLTARMTPIIKLEPLGLKFKKSLQLNIPHFTLIPESGSHSVIVYSGLTLKNNEDSSDSIRWTEERFFPRQLKRKSVTIDIQCLSYLSASLVSQTPAPRLYNVRAVPFVDGVRKTDDDITLTVCFCNDNDTEYNMLLSDYKTKLTLEQYSTLQLSLHSESDKDNAGFLSVSVTSVNNIYVPEAGQAVKKFAVSHLCTASRVSHQFRIRKNLQGTDWNDVDIMLTFSQLQYESTYMSLKAKIKDLIISEESEKRLTGCLPPAIQPYEDLKSRISALLGEAQCTKIATYFELSPAEIDLVEHNQDPGKMLIKILDEREKIMPEKMIGLYQALKFCHLDKTARLVSEYINEHSKQIQEKTQGKGKATNGTAEDGSLTSQYMMKKCQRSTRSSLSDQSVQTTMSSSCVSSDLHIKTLTNEGYSEQEVVEALDVSRNRPVMARRVLQCLGEQFVDALPMEDYIFLHKEQYIDENGGEITLREANVHLLIPVGAASKGSIVSLTVMTCKQGNVPSKGGAPQLSPVVRFGPEGSTLNKPVTLRIPHCASDIEGITSTDLDLGFLKNGDEIQWKKRQHHEPKPTLEENHFEVPVQTFCAVSMNIAVDFKKLLSKRLRVLPLISRIGNSTDDLTVTLWIYNDDETEHMHLFHEEINVRGKIQLHEFKRFTMKVSEKEEEVQIKSVNNKITPHGYTDIKKVLITTLWHNARHALEFHFHNKEGIGDISFRIRLYTKQLLNLRTVVDSQFDLKIMLSELLQKPQRSIRTLLTTQERHRAMEESFQELVNKLSGQLDLDSSLEIAGMFRLSSDLRDRVKRSSEPAKILFDELTREQLITAASVSALDFALTRTGNAHLAEDVKVYRHRNATFPTTIFTLL